MMKETDARRINRIARAIFLDIASERMARRIMAGLFHVAGWKEDRLAPPDYTGPGDYENVTGKFDVDGIQFQVENASFEVDINNRGEGLYFKWRGGTLKTKIKASGTFRNFTGRIQQGDAAINCTDATFTVSIKQGSTYIDWRNGIWNSGVFTNGFWHDGIWEKGEWWYGYWRKGTWKEGEQVIPYVGMRKDKNGNDKSVYIWEKSSENKQSRCKKIKRTSPPTGMYPVTETTKDGEKYYSVDEYEKGGEWTRDKDNSMLDPSLFPLEAIDALNSQHMSGGTSHNGRNEFMRNVDGMWNGVLNPDAPDIYRIYYNSKDRVHRSLFVLYQNGYLKIFHMNDKEQSYQDKHKLLKPASHRPASLKDLYMLSKYEIVDGFLPTPNNMILVKSHNNDGAFTDFIIQKAVLVSKFKVFDPNALDRLFFVMESGKGQEQKEKEIEKFKTDWRNAVNEISKVYKGAEAYLGTATKEMQNIYTALTAMEKVQLALKQGSSVDRKTNLMEISPREWKMIERLTQEEGYKISEDDFKNWAMNSEDPKRPDPMTQRIRDLYDDIMEKLRNDATSIQQEAISKAGT